MTEVDLDYVRRIGEEAREALFPRKRADGLTPFPTPVALRYVLPDGYEVAVKFVDCRTYHWIGEVPEDTTRFDVTFMGYYVGEVDLEFGNKFETIEDQYLVMQDPDPKLDEPLMALLRAVTGTL